MYSNNIYAFFIILCFAPLISAGVSQLRSDYYKKSCPGLQGMVWRGVWTANMSDPRMPASLLRLHFHDCFVNGCDASVLLNEPNGEQSAGPNKKSIRGFQVIDSIKAQVENFCPKIVSCADILTLAARAAVKLSITHHGKFEEDKWQPWQVVLGRLDGMTSNMTRANNDIPSPTDSVDILIAKFRAKGLNTQDLVALTGSHTIGFAHCTNFMARIYPSKDPSMNNSLFSALRNACHHKNSNLAPLDDTSPKVFDNHYYSNLLNNEGVLKTDQALASDKRTSSLVKKYSNNHESFLNDFGFSMVKMGNIDVVTTGQGGHRKGQIRRKCDSTNS